MNSPEPPAVTGLITFFYYDDLAVAEDFYARVMGFERIVDQGWAKIFRVAGEAHLGCVDGRSGHRRPAADKPVLLTVLVDDPDAWHRRLVEHGVEVLDEPRDDEALGVRIFFARDPEGYPLEIQKFY